MLVPLKLSAPHTSTPCHHYVHIRPGHLVHHSYILCAEYRVVSGVFLTVHTVFLLFVPSLHCTSELDFIFVILYLPCFRMLRWNLRPPMTKSASCWSRSFTSWTPLKWTKPYRRPFLLHCLAMKTSHTSPFLELQSHILFPHFLWELCEVEGLNACCIPLVSDFHIPLPYHFVLLYS